MKKTYQQPVTKVVVVTISHLMQASMLIKPDEASVNNSGDYETLSRRGGSLWDEDEE